MKRILDFLLYSGILPIVMLALLAYLLLWYPVKHYETYKKAVYHGAAGRMK